MKFLTLFIAILHAVSGLVIYSPNSASYVTRQGSFQVNWQLTGGELSSYLLGWRVANTQQIHLISPQYSIIPGRNRVLSVPGLIFPAAGTYQIVAMNPRNTQGPPAAASPAFRVI